jgi:signal transduction histidine kinase
LPLKSTVDGIRAFVAAAQTGNLVAMPRQAFSSDGRAATVVGGAASTGPPLRHYWPSGALALTGLIATALAGWQLDRWAQARDKERFTAEARLVVQMIEQKMERYESALGRLRDACARNNGEISSADWGGWVTHTLGQSYHYPNLVCLVVAPRITPEQRAAFEQRAAAQVTAHPGRILTSRAEADYWFPIWRRSAKSGFNEPALGDDLLAETPQHPSFERALGATVGWVTERPARLDSQQGESQVGFWFAVPLRPVEFTNRIAWQRPYESEEQAAGRRDDQRARQATGLLAAFLGGDLFLNEFNATNAKVRVQLFTSATPTPDTLLNPGQAPLSPPRCSHDAVMPWYGWRWTARITSTPLFDAAMLRYRAWLVWGVGAFLSLGSAAVLAWQMRGRWREAALAEQLRAALSRQERLSRDLHDGTLQSVYGIGLALQRAQHLLEKRPLDAAGQIKETTSALQRVIAELRDFIRETDSGAREDVPLSEALEGVIAHLKLGTVMKLELDVHPEADQGLSAAQSLQLLNIAREALSNSIRHSGGRHVRITLAQQNGIIRLEVADDGCGFVPEIARHRGHGLENLAARVRELGGKHRCETASGAGCRLVVEVPSTTNRPPDE